AKLKTALTAPASASVPTVMEELERAKAWIDMVRLFSVSLPAREVVWWACLAARDVLGKDHNSACLKAAEAWVFEPNDNNRLHLNQIIETESSGDKASLCATAAYYAPGNMGLGDMANQPAPAGVVAACTFGMTLKTVKLSKDPDARLRYAIDRAVDIARGGNGAIEFGAVSG
ncbi:MAG: hypothetical protein AAGF13_04380, partial [Pseudomonadota bacterium]